MAARMFRNRFRDLVQTKPSISNSTAEVHIFKPQREEALIQPTQFLPHRAAHHEKRPGGLLHRRTRGTIPIQAAVAAVYRIPRPDSIKQKNLQSQGGRGGKSPHHESNLAL